MVRTSLSPVLHFLRTHFRGSECGTTTDEHLLERFAFQGDETASEAIVKRHGSLVWGVCRRVLKREQDIEDAFQATFLVLVRKAHSIRRRASVTCWLHGVAHRIALQAYAQSQKSYLHELPLSIRTEEDAASEASYREVRKILDEEILNLPQRLRTPLLLCCLEGRTKAEAARELGWKEGTVASRLARARQRLQGRLTRRGVVLAAGPLGLLLAEQSSAAVPALVAAATVRMAVLFAAGEAALAGGVSASVALLTKGILNGMVLTKLKVTATLILAVSFVAASGGWAAYQVLEKEPAQEQRKDEPPPAAKKADEPKTEEAKQAKKDYYGDPLPPGVLARMGTVRLRHPYADVRFSADGKTLVSAGGDGVINFWEVGSGKLVDQKLLDKYDRSGQRSFSGEQTLSADGKAMVAISNNVLQVFDVRTGKERFRISPGKQHIGRSALSFDGKLVAAQIDSGNSIYFWDVKTGKELHVIDHKEWTPNLAFSPEGKLLGAAGRRDLRLWDTKTGVEQLKTKGNLEKIVFSPDGKLLASADAGKVILLDAAIGKEKVKLTSSVLQHIDALAFSPHGKVLAAGGQSGITLWDIPAQKELRHISTGGYWLTFSPDGKTLASSNLSSIHLWDVATGKPLHERVGHLGFAESLAVSPDGKVLASTSRIADNSLHLWNAATGKPSHVFRGLNRNILNGDISADGRWVISAKDDATVRFWEVETGKEVRKFAIENLDKKSQNTDFLNLRLSADGKRLLAIGFPSEVFPVRCQLNIWDVQTGKTVVSRQIDETTDYAISPDGHSLAFLKFKQEVVIQDTATGKASASIPGEFGFFFGFSADSKILGIVNSLPTVYDAVNKQHGIRLVEVATGKPISLIETDPLGPFAFSPDGRMLATSHKNALRILEISSGKEIFHIKRPENLHTVEFDTFVKCLAFMPSRKALATGMVDGTILIWDLTLPGRAAKDLDKKAIAPLWTDLADEAPQAYRALWTLADSPNQTIPFLKEHLKPAEEVDPKQVQRLLADLDSEEFTTREKAAKELAKLGERIEPALRKALDGQPSEEVRKQVKALLDMPRAVPTGETLRILRAIGVLEYLGTKEAAELLKKLSTGAPAARETQEAREALERLSRKLGEDR